MKDQKSQYLGNAVEAMHHLANQKEHQGGPAEFLISEHEQWPDEDFSLLASRVLQSNTTDLE